jgi:hypothetical protein
MVTGRQMKDHIDLSGDLFAKIHVGVRPALL